MSEALLGPLKPFPHQQNMLDAMAEARANGVHRYLIEGAPGVGKTLPAANRAAQHIAQDAGNRVLFLCQRRGILSHAKDTFARQCNSDINIGVIGDSQRKTDAQITVAMLQSMYGTADEPLYQSFAPDEFSLVVVDEAHHAPARSYGEVINYFEPEERLSMSAVAYRHDGLDLNTMLGPTIYRKTMPESIVEGLLAPMRYHVHTDTFSGIETFKELYPTLSPGKLDRSIFIPRRDSEIVKVFGEELEAIKDPHGLIFCKGVNHANHMAELIQSKLGYSTTPIHSRQTKTELDNAMERFKKRDIQIATVIGMFDEGVDVPSINFIGMLNDTASEGLWLNRIGRGLRLAPGKEMVTIADLTNSISRILQIDRLKTIVQQTSANAPASARNVDAQLDFSYSKDVVDILAAADDIRTRTANRHIELNLQPSEVDAPTVMPVQLAIEEDGKEKITPLSPVESVILSHIFEASYGYMTEKTLRKVCRKHFNWISNSLPTLLKDLSDEGFVSPTIESDFGTTYWRLTNKTIGAFLKIPVHVNAVKNSAFPFAKNHSLMSADIALDGFDMTQSEFDELASKIPGLTKSYSRMQQIKGQELYRLNNGNHETVFSMYDQDTKKGYEIVRLCSPAEITRIRVDGY